METSKIDEIGKKLDVEPSVIDKGQKKNRSIRKHFWLLNTMTLILSSLTGLIFGLSEHRFQSHYPFYSINARLGQLGVASINFANGKLTIPERSHSILTKNQRILVFCINLILSFVGYGILYVRFASSDQMSGGMLYNVYDSSKKNQ